MNIVRKGERRMTRSGMDQLQVEHLSSTKNVRMMLVEIPPGASTGEAHAHVGEEVHVVMKGTIYAEQGEDRAEFAEGDSFSWNACTPHLVKNNGTETATVLITVYSDTEQPQDLI
ncbi:DNA-binding transcriptional repressor PuuR [compost metagenome]